MDKPELMDKELYKVLTLFYEQSLQYNCFKCEHIFQGVNKNLDVLFLAEKDYTDAAELLIEEGYQEVMSEKVEKYKRMFVLFKERKLYAIHLHREIAWHGIIALEKEGVFKDMENYQRNEVLVVPNKEYQFLIHVAHILFENYKIKGEGKTLDDALQDKSFDWKIIEKEVTKMHWQLGFKRFLREYKGDSEKKEKMDVSKLAIVITLLQHLTFAPLQAVYVIRKILRLIVRKFTLRRKGFLIALMGVNGAGKSTMSKQIENSILPLTRFSGMKVEQIYFGWKAVSPIAIVIALFTRKKKVFEKVTVTGKKQRLSLFKELFYVYNFCEYLYRYVFCVYPALRRRRVVISDRYFYDVYGQYTNAAQSKVLPLLIRLFPTSDATFILDVPSKEIAARGKEVNAEQKGSTRKEFNLEYLEVQRQQFLELAKRFMFPVINTNLPIEESREKIISNVSEKLIKKVRK